MAIEKENIERIQRMEGYLNDYAKTLEETKKAVDQLREHQESYIQLRDYYSSQAYFDDLDPVSYTHLDVYKRQHLFTGTIAENIAYGRADATREEILEAARIANVDSFVKHLDQGYETVLTDDGAGLSNGQRQLIAIARAALANAPVLILDEATSSIDSRTEKMVQEGMDRLMEGRTVFVIAHRLSTIVNSDVIMVMDHGRIIERGNHASLMAERGTYYRLYTGGLEID